MLGSKYESQGCTASIMYHWYTTCPVRQIVWVLAKQYKDKYLEHYICYSYGITLLYLYVSLNL